MKNHLIHFLTNTEFPYTVESGGGMPGGGPGAGAPNGEKPTGTPPAEQAETNTSEALTGENNETTAIEAIDQIQRTSTASGISLSVTYETVEDYITALNAETEWVTYDANTNTASITSVADFVTALKGSSKSLAAFDALDESQGENQLFGINGEAGHFDASLAELLVGTEY